MADLCTLANVREYLQKATADTAQDAIISSLITRATTVIENYAQRDLTDKSTLTRTFQVDGSYVDFAPYDLRAATTVTLHPEGTPAVLAADVGYQLVPIGQRDDLNTYTGMMISTLVTTYSSNTTRFGYEQVSVAGSWGPSSTPLDLVHAAVITVGLWVRREVAAWSATFSPDVELQDTRPLTIPGAAMRLIEPYRRGVIG